MLKAVVDAGGFAKAAELVHKSPSSINHAVQKLQTQLGVPLLELRGRKAELTPAGEILLRRADHLLGEAREMEGLATALATGNDSLVAVAIDQLIPQDPIQRAFARFSESFPHTQVQVRETMRDEGAALLRSRSVDLLLGLTTSPGVLSESLGNIRLVCVAHPRHPLARLGRKLTLRDLRSRRQVIVRDNTDAHEGVRCGAEGQVCWEVGQVLTALNAVHAGFAYAWLPECAIKDSLDRGRLVALDLEAGGTQVLTISLALADYDRSGKAIRELARILSETFAERGEEPATMPDWWSMARCGTLAGL